MDWKAPRTRANRAAAVVVWPTSVLFGHVLSGAFERSSVLLFWVRVTHLSLQWPVKKGLLGPLADGTPGARVRLLQLDMRAARVIITTFFFFFLSSTADLPASCARSPKLPQRPRAEKNEDWHIWLDATFLSFAITLVAQTCCRHFCSSAVEWINVDAACLLASLWFNQARQAHHQLVANLQKLLDLLEKRRVFALSIGPLLKSTNIPKKLHNKRNISLWKLLYVKNNLGKMLQKTFGMKPKFERWEPATALMVHVFFWLHWVNSSELQNSQTEKARILFLLFFLLSQLALL